MEHARDRGAIARRALLGVVATASVTIASVMSYACLFPRSQAGAMQVDAVRPRSAASVTDEEGKAEAFDRVDWRRSTEMMLARKLLVDGMLSVDESVDISPAHLQSGLLSDMYHGIMDEEPHMWHVRGTCSYEATFDGTVLSVQPNYISTDVGEIEGMREEYEHEMASLLSAVSDDMGDLAKVKAIHDGIIARCSYDQACADDPSGYEVTLRNNPYGAYSAMVGGLTVCRGYSLAFKDACTRVGVPCETVRTREHEWNKVLVDGRWYNVDLTFDDTDGTQAHRYALFMKSDGYLAEYDREANRSLHAGACPTDIPAVDATYDSPTALLAALM